MENAGRRYTVRFTAAQIVQIEALAARLKVSPSDCIRQAVDMFLVGGKAAHEAELRHHRISEFTQLCVDTLIRETHPEKIDAIVLETGRRMERYHGAR